MPLTKAQIVDSIYNRLDISKNTSIEVVQSLLEIIKRTLADGEDVLITGFGKFCVKDKEKRRGRNPQTGKDMTLRPRRVVTFRCSGVLRDRINGRN
jgi:integration host factor subunit alpha